MLETLASAARWGRTLDGAGKDRFVGMSVKDSTRDFEAAGREAVRLFPAEAFDAGLVPRRIEPEFVAPDS